MQVESNFLEAPKVPGAEGSVNYCMFNSPMSSLQMWPWLLSVEKEGPGAGFMGLSEVDRLPVYVSSSTSFGEQHLLEGSQCSECTTPEEGDCGSDFHSWVSPHTPDMFYCRWCFGSCC